MLQVSFFFGGDRMERVRDTNKASTFESKMNKYLKQGDFKKIEKLIKKHDKMIPRRVLKKLVEENATKAIGIIVERDRYSLEVEFLFEFACMFGKINIITYLISLVDINSFNLDHAIKKALIEGQFECATLIFLSGYFVFDDEIAIKVLRYLPKEDFKRIISSGAVPISRFVDVVDREYSQNSLELAQVLLEEGDEYVFTQIIRIATFYDHIRLLKLCMSFSTNFDVKDLIEYTCIHNSVYCFKELIKLVDDVNDEYLNELLLLCVDESSKPMIQEITKMVSNINDEVYLRAMETRSWNLLVPLIKKDPRFLDRIPTKTLVKCLPDIDAIRPIVIELLEKTEEDLKVRDL